MAKGQITIDEKLCKGCGYCAKFCTRGCIVISKDKFTTRGYMLPVFDAPDKCNACGVCGWMCPEYAIEVYKLVKGAVP
jgi:NAD-dependent dihydropyrimidine dehydrogenase PreA subunit